jgi:hypothetical protein
MAVLNIFSPGWFENTQSTQLVQNPWGTSDVWVQCTVSAFQINDTPSLVGFGIIEIEFLDNNGNPQSTTFGDLNNLNNVIPEDLPSRLFQPRMVSVTLALIGYNTGSAGTVTLFEWG